MTNFLGSANSRYYAVAHSSRLIVGKEDAVLWQKEIPFDEYELLALGSNGYLFVRSPEGIHVFDLKGDLIHNPIPRWSRHELASSNAYLGGVKVSADGRRLMIEKVSLQARLTQRLFELLSSTRVEPDTLLHEIYTYDLDDDSFRFFYRSKCSAALQKNQRFLWDASVDFEWVSFIEPDRPDRLRLSLANLANLTIEHEFTIPALKVEGVRVGRQGTTLLDAVQGGDRGLVIIGTDGVHHPLTSTASARILHLGASFVAIRTAPVPFLLIKGFDDRLVKQADLRALDKLGISYEMLFNERDAIDVVTLVEGNIRVMHSNLEFLETDVQRWEKMASAAERGEAMPAPARVAEPVARPDQRRSTPISMVAREAQTYDSFVDLFTLSGTTPAAPPVEAPPPTPARPPRVKLPEPSRKAPPRLEMGGREPVPPSEDLTRTRRMPAGDFPMIPPVAEPRRPEPQPAASAEEAYDFTEPVTHDGGAYGYSEQARSEADLQEFSGSTSGPSLYYDPVLGWVEETSVEPVPEVVPSAAPETRAGFPGAPAVARGFDPTSSGELSEAGASADGQPARPVILRRTPGGAEGEAGRGRRGEGEIAMAPRAEEPVAPEAPAGPVVIERAGREGGRRGSGGGGRHGRAASRDIHEEAPSVAEEAMPLAEEVWPVVEEVRPVVQEPPVTRALRQAPTTTPIEGPAAGPVEAPPPVAPPPGEPARVLAERGARAAAAEPASPPPAKPPVVPREVAAKPLAPAAKPPAPAAEPSAARGDVDRKRIERLIEMLEVRYQDGQVTEAVYEQLKAKYRAQLGAD